MASEIIQIIQSFIALDGDGGECNEFNDTKKRDFLVRSVLDNPEVFTFGELLENPEIGSFLSRHQTLRNLFLIFAYGTYQDYLRITQNGTDFSKVDKLTAAQERKLKQLSLITLATQSCAVNYDDMSASIHAQSLREMEDFVIDALIYPGLVSGRLDQRGRVFCVGWVFVQRDVRREDVPALVVAPLRQWACECERVMDQMRNQATTTAHAIAEAQKEKEYFVECLRKVKALNEQQKESGMNKKC